MQPPVLKNFHTRIFAYTALVVTVGVTVYSMVKGVPVPDGFYAWTGAVVLGWMGVAKWGETVATVNMGRTKDGRG